MKSSIKLTRNLLLVIFVLSLFPLISFAAEKLPAEKAGVIGQPDGRIAFIRNGSIWVYDTKGANADMICESINADGRLSWAPDGKRIAFTRSGLVDLKGPDPMVGGRHKVYDIFIAWLDSAYHNNRMWWTRITDDLGSSDPEWSADGNTIYFTKDMNANFVNAFMPNHQICSISPDGSDFNILRKDWQNFSDDFMRKQTVSKDGKVASVTFNKLKPIGIVMTTLDNIMLPVDSIRAQGTRNQKMVGPAFSPDGKWLAYINNNMSEGGLYIATPDLKEKYLVFKPRVGNIYLHNMAPSFSPDSKWLTFSTTDGSIWICDITGNGAQRLSGPGLDKFPAWSK